MHSRASLGLAMLLLTVASMSCGAAGEAEEAPREAVFAASGKVTRWPEAMKHLHVAFDGEGEVHVALGDARPSGLDAFWSVASTRPGSGFFYADSIRGTAETRVAYAELARRVDDIRDFSRLAFTHESVGPVPVGGIVVVEHGPTGRHLALVLDAIEPTDPRTAGPGPYAYADVSWYLSAEGSTGF